ncbi:hypothetical protein E8E13_004207 [Curvularia kusanoi]|uniref:Uncharacterized protein n=1 Tax=Curvularia kusanoi TaxID=90978 RepID=A0A9P4W7E1_CURKU|nr:hypothetical protein E8E13_004207 [Curvularia kusanoi]
MLPQSPVEQTLASNDAIGAECSTGNCTWPVFTSAAVCSSCENVSHEIVRREFFGRNGTNIPSFSNFYNESYIKFELPYANIRNYKGFLNTTDDRFKPTYMTANTTVYANRTVAFKESETLLMAFLMMQTPKEWLEGRMKWEDAEPVATECALYFCANAYEAKSENNLVTESILDTWVHKIPGSYVAKNNTKLYEPDAGAAWIKSVGSTLYDAKIDRTDLQLRIPEEESEHLPSHVLREFNVSHAFTFSAIDFLLDYTKGWLQPLNPSQNLPKSPPDETWGMMGSPFWSTSQSAVMDALMNSTNLTVTFNNVARSITNQIRNSSPDRHRGELKHWVIHVQVDWVYLVYPLAMLIAGIIYVVLTIFESRRLKMPVWKESSMPTLLHGFDDETQTLLRSEFKASQRKMLVRFMEDENGYQRLVAQQ